LVAIIVPDKDAFFELVSQKLKISSENQDFEELCQNKEVVEMIVKYLE